MSSSHQLRGHCAQSKRGLTSLETGSFLKLQVVNGHQKQYHLFGASGNSPLDKEGRRWVWVSGRVVRGQVRGRGLPGVPVVLGRDESEHHGPGTCFHHHGETAAVTSSVTIAATGPPAASLRAA